MKAAIAAIVLIAGLIVGGLFAAPLLVDAEAYRETVVRQARDALGLDVAIAGDMDFRILPAPRLVAGDVRVSAPGAVDLPPLLGVRALDLRLSLADLLTGDVVIRRVVLHGPLLTLATALNGRNNHVLPDGALSGLKVDVLEVREGSLVWDDRHDERSARVGGVDLTLAASAPGGPYRIEGAGTVGERTVGLEGLVAQLALPTRLTMDLKADGLGTARLRGRLTGNPDVAWQGQVEANLDDILALGGADAQAGADAVPGRVAADLLATSRRAELSGLTLQVGGVDITGRAALDVSGPLPRLTLALAIEQLNGDALVRWFGGVARASATGGMAALTLPADVEADLRLDVGVARLGDGVLRQAAFDGTLRRGALTVGRASALLPGGSDVAFTGTFRTPGGAPRLDGSIEAASDNLRALLDWAGVDTAGISAARLRHAGLSAGITANSDVLQAFEIDFRLDQTRVAGGAAIAMRARPSFSLDLRLDRLNLDAYADGLEAAGLLGGGGLLERARVLTGFDTNTRIVVDELVAGARALRDVRADLSLLGGKLALSGLSVGDIAGTSVRLQGTFDANAGPVFALQGNAQGGDAGRLLDVLDIARDSAAARLGRFAGEFSLEGNADSVGFDVDLAAESGRYRANGQVSDPDGAWRHDTEISVSGANLAAVMQVLAPALRWPARLDGDVVIEGKISGGLDEFGLTGRVDALGGRLETDGRVGPDGYGGTVTVRHGSTGMLLRRLVGGMADGLQDGGPLVAGGRVDITPRSIRIDGLSIESPDLSGTGQLAFSRGSLRPGVTGSLSGLRIDLDAMRGAAPEPVGGPEGRRFPLVPLDLFWLGAFDADVTGDITLLRGSGLELSGAAARLRIADGRLDLEARDGRLAAGVLDLGLQVSGPGLPAVQARIGLRGVDLAELLPDGAAGPGLRGFADIDAELAARGVTPFDMVRGLNGSIRLGSEGLVVGGQNIAALFAEPAPETDAAFAGGETVYGPVSGTWTVEGGVLRNDGAITLGHPMAAVTLVGSIDVARWRLDLEQRFRIDGRPPFAVRIGGPLDAAELTPVLP
ncbi:MAG: AsmA family protein [Pseudomonadota bacterium]|nr:AsmA family protein [Pseudomonadota bacterium]